jgi:hypothetical protein
MIRTSIGAARVSATATFAATCLLILSSASAGLKVNVPVTVDLVNNTARGALGQTFNTSNRTENIGCYIHYWLESSTYATCEAYTATGVRGSCYTGEAHLLEAIRSLNGDSVLTFSWVVVTPQRHDCTSIQVETTSATQPKR